MGDFYKKLLEASRYVAALLILAGILIQTGCLDTCADLNFEEPTVDLDFVNNDADYSRVYALKPGPVEIIPGISRFILPLNLNQPSTVYIFESATVVDTLELRYESDTKLNPECGFYVEVINLHSGPRTTMDSVIVHNSNFITKQ